MSEEFADGTVETPNEEVNWEERAKKAEAKIVELKKTPKEVEPTGKKETEIQKENFDESIIDAMLERKDFIKSNPELVWFEDRLKELTSSGFTLQEAKWAILAGNPELANRQKTNSMSMTWEAFSSDKTVYTQDELVKIAKENQQLYNKLTERLDKGEITIK